jgi:uncharacterized protein YecT (DUF1311 family)
MKHLFLQGFVVSATCLASLTVHSTEPVCNGNALQVESCQAAALDAAEKRLNGVYSLVMKMFDAGAVDPVTSFFSDKKQRVVIAERAWVRFRDTQCAAEGILVIPGSGVPTVTGRCLLTLTEERIQFLEGLERELRYTSKFCEKDDAPCKLL